MATSRNPNDTTTGQGTRSMSRTPERSGAGVPVPPPATGGAVPARLVEPGRDYHARHENLLVPNRMESAHVLLLGDGSLGSLIASFLVRAGIGSLTHYDNELVEETNICRTAYGERDIGRPKTEALNDILRAIRRDVVLEGRQEDIHATSDEALVAEIAKASVSIIATDHPPTQARTAALSYFRVPAIIPGVYAKGTGGEVVLTIPDESACWHCVFAGIRTEEQPDRGTEDYGLATGQLKAEPALGTDIANVAVAAAKLAIAVLNRGTGLEIEKMVQPERNVLFLGNSIDWAFRDYNEAFWARTIRRPDCPVCSKRPALHARATTRPALT